MYKIYERAPQTPFFFTHTSPPNKSKSQALICQREQSLRDNLIVFSTSPVFDVSGMVAIEQTIILLISLVFSNFPACDIPLKLPDQTLNSIWLGNYITRTKLSHFPTKYCKIKCLLSEPQPLQTNQIWSEICRRCINLTKREQKHLMEYVSGRISTAN